MTLIKKKKALKKRGPAAVPPGQLPFYRNARMKFYSSRRSRRPSDIVITTEGRKKVAEIRRKRLKRLIKQGCSWTMEEVNSPGFQALGDFKPWHYGLTRCKWNNLSISINIIKGKSKYDLFAIHVKTLYSKLCFRLQMLRKNLVF